VKEMSFKFYRCDTRWSTDESKMGLEDGAGMTC